jgi:hypothetical protein
MLNRHFEGKAEIPAAEDGAGRAEDDEPFFTITMPEATTEQRLAIYMVYREMGGRPYEPTESLYREHTATAQQPSRAQSPTPLDRPALPPVHAS